MTKYFGGLTAVGNLECQIDSGELVAVIGPNGSGKTTFFNLITGMHRPSSGSLRFDGKEIIGSKPYQVARHGIGRTFQKTTIFRRSTVLDNVIVGHRIHTRTGICGATLRTPATRKEEHEVTDKALEMLSFVGLLDKAHQIADKLTQEAQKRLSIAVALAVRPKLLLLDEPTGGVNLEEIGGLIDLVKRIQKAGTTICIIEHKMRMVMNISDRIIVLNHGVKIAEGAPSEIARNAEVIKAYLGPRYVA